LYRGYCRDENVAQFVRKNFIETTPLVFEALNRFEHSFDPKEFHQNEKIHSGIF
jgi:hypothetical protein